MSFKSGAPSCKNKTEGKESRFVLSPTAKWVKAVFFAGIAGAASAPAFSQETTDSQEQAQDPEVEVIDVVGTRKTIQDQIAIKRESTTIVDGLSADDIGDLPALSIGEALESITGAASHRENGGATEITIRGLGPFLSATHINGREATNGSGDRSVNFSQFPSELVRKVAIYKTQDASMIEGGVAGLVTLETVKPLDFGKQRFQAEVKLNYNPDQQNIDNSLQSGLGYRGTISYVDQFELDNGQSIGLSVGVQRQDISQPEAESRGSSPSGSSLWACLFDPTNTNEGFFRSSAGDCEDQVEGGVRNQGYQTEIDPETGLARDDGKLYAFTGSSRGYRQNETSDTRDAVFFGMQFRPTQSIDINVDAQVSERVQAEARHDLIILQKRSVPGLTGPSLVVNDVGGILAMSSEDRVESAGEQFSRTEDYQGYGVNVQYFASPELSFNFDVSYSETNREEIQISNRGRTLGGSDAIAYSWRRGSEIPHFTFTNFDVTDISNFTNDLRTRLDRENVRDHQVIGAKLDVEYIPDSDVFSKIRAGIRSAEMNFVQFGGTNGNGSRNEQVLASNSVSGLDVLQGCQIDFPETDFLSSVSDGNIVTNVDESGNVISSGTGNSWATYNNNCFSQAIYAANGEDYLIPDVIYQNAGTIDVTETTNAIYAMAEFDTELGDYFVRGNFGVRVVDTEVESIGFRNAFDVVNDPLTGEIRLVTDPSGLVEQVVGGGGYTELLPSANLVVDLREDILLRAGVYRGMSRVDPSDMGFNRTFVQDNSDQPDTIQDLLVGVSGSGNPDSQPLMSWNFDIGAEWYPNDDAIFALGFYYKQFQGGFENRTVLENFIVEGESVSLPITNQTTVDDTSNLFGLEATIAYRWDFGMGIKLGYNYADSDFEFNDSLYGDTFETDIDGNRTQLTAGILPTGNVPGLSKNVFSGQVYYQIGELDMALIYKYRDSYFQPYTGNGTRLRFVDDVGVVEARVTYRVNSNVRVRFEAINLFSEPKSQDFFVQGNLGEVNDYGPRLFAGISFKY